MRFSKVLVLASWGLVSRAGFANGGITTAVDDDCVSAGDDPDYYFELALLDDFRLLWSVADSSVSVKAVYQGEGWLGIGFSDAGSMPGSDAVVGLPEDGTALEYDMPNYAAPVEAEDQELSDATITQAGGVTTLTFVRPLEPTGEGKQVNLETEVYFEFGIRCQRVLSESGSIVWLYAWGSTNEFVVHTFQRAVSFSLDACAAMTGDGAGAADADDADAAADDDDEDDADSTLATDGAAKGAPSRLGGLVILVGTSLLCLPFATLRA